MFRIVKDLFVKKKSAAAESGEYKCEAAGFRISYDADQIAVYFGLSVDPSFVLSGINYEEPVISSSVLNGVSAKTVKFGSDLSITLISSNENLNFLDKFSVKKAQYHKVPNVRHGLELDVMFGMDEVRYLADFSLECNINYLNELNIDEDEAISVPPVSQMVAFLKAALSQRRTIIQSLSGFARHCEDEGVNKAVKFIAANFRRSDDFMHYSVLSLRDRLEQRGKRINFNSLAAMCLLTDIYIRKHTEDYFRNCLENKQIVGVSSEACAAVGAFLGDSDFEIKEDTDAYSGLQFLKKTVGGRTLKTVLYDIAQDGGSKRSISAVKKLIDTVDSKDLELKEREPLALLLEASGKRIKDDTAAALCLYTDLEIGVITEKHIEQFLPDIYLADHSAYALTAVGRNFGLDLHCLKISADNPEEALCTLKCLLSLSENGVLAKFLDISSNKNKTFYVKDADEFERISSSYLFTGKLICALPVIDGMNSEDFGLFLKKQKNVCACFVPEDRRVCWKHVHSGSFNKNSGSEHGKYSFIEGCRAYRFGGRILGSASEAKAEELEGRNNIIAVCEDASGKKIYRFLPFINSADDLNYLGEGVSYSGRILTFPDLQDLKCSLYELETDQLAGLALEESPEYLRLAGCMNGIRAALLSKDEMVSLRDNTELLDKLRTAVNKSELRNSLIEVLEFSSRCRLSAALGKEGRILRGNIKIHKALADALENESACEIAAMMILYAMCRDKKGHLSYFDISWSPDLFRSLILERLFEMIHGESISVRILACRLLASDMFSETSDSYEAVVYVLSGLLNDKQIGNAASLVLGRLILSSSLNLESFVQIERFDRIDISKESEEYASEEIFSGLNHWLEHPPVSAEDRSLVVSAMANLRGEKDKIKNLSVYISKINDILRRERCNKDASRKYIIINSGEDVNYRKKLLAVWKEFLNSCRFPLASKSYGAHIYDEFSNYMLEKERSGNTVLVKNAQVYKTDVWYQIMVSTDPLFVKLASSITLSTSENISLKNIPILCRCSDKAFIGSCADLGGCEIFCPESNAWIPFMSSRFSMLLRASAEDMMVYQNLERTYAALAGFNSWHSDEELSAVPLGMVSAADKKNFGGAKRIVPCRNLMSLAEQLSEGFRISLLYKQVLDVLLSCREQSLCELLPDAE